MERVYTEEEIAFVRAGVIGMPVWQPVLPLKSSIQRWQRSGRCRWVDVEVCRTGGGRPRSYCGAAAGWPEGHRVCIDQPSHSREHAGCLCPCRGSCLRVVTAEEMKALDRTAIEEYGISGLVLMENAAAMW